MENSQICAKKASKRSFVTLVACEECRKRKARCDGGRPRCHRCVQRDCVCVFATTDAKTTRTAALKSENERLRTESARLDAIIQRLQHPTLPNYNATLSQIRPADAAVGVPTSDAGDRFLDHEQSQTFTQAAGKNYQQNGDPATVESGGDTPPPSCITESSRSGNPGRKSGDHALRQEKGDNSAFVLPRAGCARSSIRSPSSDRRARCAKAQQSLKSHVQEIHQGYYFRDRCISEVFYCKQAEAFESLFASISLSHFGTIALPLLCEACAEASSCGQFMRLSISSNLLDFWHETARNLVDECVAIDPAIAIRVFALLGFYHVLNKSTTAVKYFESGLLLAEHCLRNKVSQHFCTSTSAREQITCNQKSMVFCYGWLQSTLGYVTTNPALYNFEEKDLAVSHGENESNHDHFANVAMLNAAAMRSLWKCATSRDTFTAITHIRMRLVEQDRRLPHQMRLGYLKLSGSMNTKTSSYYIQLLLLGTTMLTFRRRINEFGFVDARAGLNGEEMQFLDRVLIDGLMAAQTSARILSFLRQCAQCVRHCWITIFQSYVSGLILIYDATQLRLLGFAHRFWGSNMDLAAEVLDVLYFCKELDPVAYQFFKRLSAYYDMLKELPVAETAQSKEMHDRDTALRDGTLGPSPVDYLFDHPTPPLAWCDLLSELLNSISNP